VNRDRDRIIRVTELFDAPAAQVGKAVAAVVPSDVHSRLIETPAGAYLTLHRRLADPPALGRMRAIRYLQGVVSDITRQLEFGHIRSFARHTSEERPC
jgi:hypothetical protein